MRKLFYVMMVAMSVPAAGAQAQMVTPSANPAGRGTDVSQIIEKKTFLAQMEQYFDAMDANHDGKLTPDELEHQAAAVQGTAAPAASPPPAGNPRPAPIGIPPVNGSQIRKNQPPSPLLH